MNLNNDNNNPEVVMYKRYFIFKNSLSPVCSSKDNSKASLTIHMSVLVHTKPWKKSNNNFEIVFLAGFLNIDHKLFNFTGKHNTERFKWVNGSVWWLNWDWSIVEKFFRIHLRQKKNVLKISIITEFERKVNVQNHQLGLVRF